jgi:glycosyltransferase involved in cell wall biosynthesis|tara:strand:- start:613 stop:1296 length:684 start_codon:yes stop_codon:yes gene_type:complete
MSNLSIIIPSLNEEDSLKFLLEELKDYKEIIGEIIVVDGNSTDYTIKVAQQYNCKIIEQNKKNIGFGSAIDLGVKNSIYEYSLILDADGSKNPKYIKDLLYQIKLQNVEFIFAERYGKNANSLDDTLLTYIGNRIFTILGKILFNLRINDILHTFFICKNESYKKIDFKIKGFGFCVELPIKVHQNKIKYSTIPTIERKRIAGNIKVRSFIDGYKILFSMIKLFTNS